MASMKRLIASVLCMAMLLSFVPFNASAAEVEEPAETVVTQPTEAVTEPAETEAPSEVPTEEPTEAPTEAPVEQTEAPVEETEAPAVVPTLPEQIDAEEPEEDASVQGDSDAVKVEHNGTTTYYADLEKAFAGIAPSNNTYGGTYVITLLGDISGMTAVKNFQYPTEILDITLDLNGHTITGNGTNIALNINMGSNASGISGGTFTLKDSSGNNSGKITGGKGGVYVYGKNVTFYFQGGTITGNHGASKGGGILVGATTKLVMTGGVITGNSVTGTSSANTGLGGGICANYADILGGAVYGNEAKGGTGKYTGRGGGLCTEITRTTGYSTLNITNGVIYGNTAENAGDDLMPQGNGNVKFTLIIGTENWYIDGWNGTKQSAGQTDRYSAENPVPYTGGGFTDTKNQIMGLKYVAAPAVTEYTVTYTDGVEGQEIFADQVYTVEEGEATPAFEGTPVRAGYNFLGWEPAVAETVTADATYTASWEAVPSGEFNGVTFRGDNEGLAVELQNLLALESV